MGKARTGVIYVFVNEFIVPILIKTSYIDRFQKSVHTAEWEI